MEGSVEDEAQWSSARLSACGGTSGLRVWRGTEVAANSETMGLGKTGKGGYQSVFLETLLEEDLFKHMFID